LTALEGAASFFLREFKAEPAAIERAAAELRGSWVLTRSLEFAKPHC
jgi:hypothetical protein